MKKLLALLCVVALLGALCVPTFATEEMVPVVAEAPAEWSNVYLYAWGTDGEYQPWPGVLMVEVEDWYCTYMPNTMENVIITNGEGAQTGDLAVDPGMPVCVLASNPGDASVEPDLPIEVPPVDELVGELPSTEPVKVHAYVPEDWADCTLYAWGDRGDIGGWPGVAMTQVDGRLWEAEMASGFANVIIASGNGSIQTTDLAYAGGECWVVLTEAGADGKFQAAVVYEEPADYDNVEVTGPAVPTSSEWYVAGTMNEWTCNDGAYKMTDNGDGTFSFTFSVTAGNHALKVTNGTWDVSFGGNGADGNYEFAAAADCEVTVVYDGNGVVTVSGDGITEGQGGDNGGDNGSVTVAGPLYVAGTMNEWNCADEAYKMTDNGNGTHSISFAITAGAHSLKVTNGTWDQSWGGDGENGNYDFNVDADGTVTVTFDGTAVNVTMGDAPATESTTEATEGTEGTNATEPTTGADTTEQDGGSNNTIWIIVAVVIVLVGAVAVFIILKKK